MSRREHFCDADEQKTPPSRKFSSSRFTSQFMAMTTALLALIIASIRMVGSFNSCDGDLALPCAIEPVRTPEATESEIGPSTVPPESAPELATHEDDGTSLMMGNNQRVAERIFEVLMTTKFNEYEIGIRFSNGTMWLEGTVCDEVERSEVAQLLSTVPEVKSVINELLCDPNILKTREVQSRICEKISRRILSSKYACYHTTLTTYQDRVTISGTVCTEEEREEIGQICWKVTGVRSVDNQLQCDPEAEKRPEGWVELLRKLRQMR